MDIKAMERNDAALNQAKHKLMGNLVKTGLKSSNSPSPEVSEQKLRETKSASFDREKMSKSGRVFYVKKSKNGPEAQQTLRKSTGFLTRDERTSELVSGYLLTPKDPNSTRTVPRKKFDIMEKLKQ